MSFLIDLFPDSPEIKVPISPLTRGLRHSGAVAVRGCLVVNGGKHA